ncbi:MAG: formate dehydrogenase accessory protein FdhE [Planctomycetia bacterium]|nr:formate dehydrogenase accessory protein FdhE [Planctomycetia bacterium]
MALRDWNPFTRRDDPAPLPPALASALADLDRLSADRPELAGASLALSRVLRAAFLAPAPVTGLHADPELIAAAWRTGVPAFRAGDAPPALDRDDLRARATSVVESLGAGNPHALPLLKALRDGSVAPHAWALSALSDRPEAVDDQAAALGLDPSLVRSVLRLTLLASLAGLSEALAAIRPEGLWTRGHCPNCGSPPALSESRGLEQRRYWRCGVCAAGWEGERLRCPFCDETDHRRLHYRFAEGEQDRYRLALCDTCGGRLKVISTLAPIPAPGLLVAELTTLHLDATDDGSVPTGHRP